MSNLFSEIIVSGKNIKNRVVMPPMVCFEYPAQMVNPRKLILNTILIEQRAVRA